MGQQREAVLVKTEGLARDQLAASFLVDPEYAGRGIGRALRAHILDQARADGYRAMQFNAVVETNIRAVALWRSLGFEILTTIPEAFHHPVDGYVGLHIMYRRLCCRASSSRPAGDTPIGLYCGICGER